MLRYDQESLLLNLFRIINRGVSRFFSSFFCMHIHLLSRYQAQISTTIFILLWIAFIISYFLKKIPFLFHYIFSFVIPIFTWYNACTYVYVSINVISMSFPLYDWLKQGGEEVFHDQWFESKKNKSVICVFQSPEMCDMLILKTDSWFYTSFPESLYQSSSFIIFSSFMNL